MCDAICIGNTHQTPKKIIDGHFYDLLRHPKNRKKSDSFDAHFEQHFKSTIAHIDLRKCITSNVVNKINTIGAMKTFTKPNCNLCLE